MEFLKNNKEFFFLDKHKYLLEVEEKRIKRYLEETERTMFHATLCGKPCGIVFAEQHRSLLGNYLAEKYSYCIDYVVIINLQQGLSFRCIKDNINVGQIATVFGGGGHVCAAGCSIDAPDIDSAVAEIVKKVSEVI